MHSLSQCEYTHGSTCVIIIIKIYIALLFEVTQSAVYITCYIIKHDLIKTTSEMSVNMNNNSINRVPCTKYLGVTIDHKLMWFEHINYKNKVEWV